MAADLAGPGYHINRSNLLVLESKADMQKRGQASPDDGDALALTFAQPLEPAEVEEEDEEEEFGRYTGSSNSGWMRLPYGRCMLNRWPPPRFPQDDMGPAWGIRASFRVARYPTEV